AMRPAVFAPREATTLTTAAGLTLARQTFSHAKEGPLRFGLGFSGPGARLRLLVVAPGGERLEHEDAGSFMLDIDNAPAGDWHYTVTGVETPYPHFPFTLIIGDKSKLK